MSESTLRLKTYADLQALRDYTHGVDDLRGALERLKASGATTGGEGGSGGGGGGFAAPAPPAPASSIPSAPGQALAPAPGPVAGPSGGGGGGGGSQPPAPSPPPPPAPPPAPPAGRPESRLDRARDFVSHTTSTAFGVALGGSIEGFLMQSGQTYMELSRTLNTLDQRFRETGDGAAYMGARLGYTIAQTAQFMEVLGGETNGINKKQLSSAMGFARHMGQDPGAVAGFAGKLSRLSGTTIGDAELAQVGGWAWQQNMDNGRMAEFMQSISGLADRQFEGEGHVDFQKLMAIQALPASVFGPDDARGMGDAGASFLGRLDGSMQGQASRSFLMRSMGYGTAGGPGYIDMKKRLDAGAMDPENIQAMFGGMQAMGMGRGAQFRALESVAGGQLKAHEIEALVDSLGTTEGLESFRSLTENGGEAATMAFASTLGKGQSAAFGKGGMADLGRKSVDMGSAYAVQTEQMQMWAGEPIARSMLDLRETLMNLIDVFGNVAGIDLGAMLNTVTDFAKKGSAWLDASTEAGGGYQSGVGFLSNPSGYAVRPDSGLVGGFANGYQLAARGADALIHPSDYTGWGDLGKFEYGGGVTGGHRALR